MKVFYDNQIFCAQRFGGISRYFYEIIKNTSNECVLAKAFCGNVYAASLGIAMKPPVPKCNFKGKWRVEQLLKKTNLHNNVKHLKDKSVDIVHPTYYDPYFLQYIGGKRLVIDAHDMIQELFPQYFRKDDPIIAQKRASFLAADRIIAVSENTKRDLLRIYPTLQDDKIDIAYRGVSFEAMPPAASRSDYILFTGNREYYKNFALFARAVAPLLKKHGLRLVCTGRPFTWQESGLMEFLGISDRTECRFASEAELQELYANALLFCFPSMYEGFGIPILEAFAAGTPLVCSNTSCFPEVAGEAAVYFDPYSESDMREKLEGVILSSALQDALVQKGQERLKAFSWQKCTAQVEETYRKAMTM